MPGILFYNDLTPKPKVGDLVYIVVDSVNRPTGFWSGMLTEVNAKDWPRRRNNEQSCECKAKITDTRIKNVDDGDSFYFEREPSVNYSVLSAHQAVAHLQQQRAEDQAEIRGLKRRREIERETFLAALRAMVSDSGFTKLEQLLNGFLTKLGQ